MRNLAETWIQNIGVPPFYPTINQNQEPSDDLWMTVDYESFGATKETYCNEFLEDGEIRLIFIGRVGIGYATVMQAAEAFTTTFLLNTDPNGRLVLLNGNPPIDFAGSNDPWFVIEIAVEYQFR